jgi:hypothetical protein
MASNMKKLIICAMMFFPLNSLGCSSQQAARPFEVNQVIVSKPAYIPPGVVQYCWEEPMVKFEHNGPGLNDAEHWYHPAHVAIREVRMGKWRPCEPYLSETDGVKN